MERITALIILPTTKSGGTNCNWLLNSDRRIILIGDKDIFEIPKNIMLIVVLMFKT